MRGATCLVALLLAGCAAPVTPRLASWEPVLAAIPEPRDTAQARQRLLTSAQMFRRFLASPVLDFRAVGRRLEPLAPGRYSYVRARQVSEQRVDFTLLEVDAGRVVLRALLTANPSGLEGRLDRVSKAAAALWVERGPSVGSHDEGAAAYSVEQLYAQCSDLIESSARPPRLYFHPNGLLMMCGFPAEECSSCPSVSLQSISRFSLLHEKPSQDAAAWLCASQAGLFPPGSDNGAVPDGIQCWAAERPDLEAALPVRVPAPDESERSPLCQLDPTSCPSESVGDICKIDPAACPHHELVERARWVAVFSDGFGFRLAFAPLEVGKADPLGEWRLRSISAWGR